MTQINAVANMSATNPAYPASSSVLNITSNSSNATTYTVSVTGSSPTETMTLSPTVGAAQATYNNLNQLAATAAGGAVRFQGTTNNPIKAGVALPTVATINLTHLSPNTTGYAQSTSPGATETITLAPSGAN